MQVNERKGWMIMWQGVFITTLTEEHVRAWKNGNESRKSAGYLISKRTGKEYLLTKPQSIIGKDERVDFLISDNPYVGKRHAIIHKENGQFFIEDMGSSNGTKVDGGLLEKEQKVLLDSSVDIEFANEHYRFELR